MTPRWVFWGCIGLSATLLVVAIVIGSVPGAILNVAGILLNADNLLRAGRK